MRAEGEYINVNELYGSVTDGSGGKVKGMSYNSSKARHAEINGVVKYDHWLTVLEAYNTEISAEGGYVEDLLEVKSYGTDYKGTIHQMKESGDITFSKNYISENTSTTSTVSHDITITQVKTGKSITVTLTQAKAEEEVVVTGYSYGVPTPTSSSIGSTTAKGTGSSPLYLTVWWTQKKYTNYSDGTSTSETISGSSRATIVSGSANNSSGAYISSGGVIVPSAGTTYYTSQRTAYTISRISFTANNVSSGNVSWTDYVSQSANNRDTYYRNYKVSLSASPDPVASYGQTTTISVTSTKESYYLYTSGDTETIGTVSCNAILTSSDGQFYNSGSYVSSITVSNGGSVTFLPNNNFTADDRILEVLATNADSTSATYTLDITQNAAEYEFYFKETSSSIDSSGGSMELTLVNSVNGGYLAISESAFSMTNGSISNVVIDDLVTPLVEWKVTVNVNSNSSSSSRNAVITATQPTSGKVATHTISQAGVSSAVGYVTIDQLVDYLYVSGSTISGFSSISRFTITASGGTVAACSYMLSLYIIITTTDGEVIEARYDHESEYISIGAVSTSTTVYFVNFPTFIDLQELTWFDPSYMTIQKVEIRPELTYKDGSGRLSFKENYEWEINN